MQNNKPRMYSFDEHCSSDLPYYCLFHSAGSPMHCHTDFYEITLVVSGSYCHTIQNRQYDCDLGHLFLLKPGETHAFDAKTDHSYHYSVILKPHYFENYCMTHGIDYEQIWNGSFVEKKLSGSQFAYLSQLASDFSRSYSREYLPAAERFLYNALFACLHNFPVAVNENIENYAIDVLKRMDSFEIINMDITDIYQDYPVSSTTLILNFKNLTGYTIVQYRNIKRMEYAAYLLAEENYSVNLIADMLNISSISHFTQQFKKAYGVTPKQYQIQHRIYQQ